MKLLTAPTAQAKMAKSAKSGKYLPYILHLAPADVSGYNTCPKATAGCKAACLNTAGMGVFSNVQQARINKTKYFFEQRTSFYAQLIKEIASAQRKADKLGKQLTVRLNGTSDLQWEVYKMQDGKTIFELFPTVLFYDYTKIEKRNPQPYNNYSLTFSAADGNDDDVRTAIDKGMNVAVVFRGDTLPQEWQGKQVIDGDTDDLRFLDPRGVIVGLRAKGKAKKDVTGFVKDGSYFSLNVL
jgi:hypothetical protein